MSKLQFAAAIQLTPMHLIHFQREKKKGKERERPTEEKRGIEREMNQ